jgi:GT2 family glycosyltransferase
VPSVAVIVLAFGPEPLLDDCIRSILASRDVEVELLLVDNGCPNPQLAELGALPGVRLLTPGRNLGFAGGVAFGVDHASAEYLCLINSDAVVEPDAVAELVARTAEPGVGIVSGSVRFHGDPQTVNSAGNPLHVLGFAWAGGFGADAADHVVERPVAVASGAAMAMRRTVWDELGGFEPRFFMYHEDVDLSLAAWQHGYRVEYVPTALVHHDYHFSRTSTKVYYAERNRLVVVVTRWPGRLLVGVLPLLVAVELGSVIVGGLPGLRRAKLRAWWWLVRNRSWLRDRRRSNLTGARQPAAFVPLLETRFGAETPASGGLAGRVLDEVVPRYARLLRLPVGRGGPVRGTGRNEVRDGSDAPIRGGRDG